MPRLRIDDLTASEKGSPPVGDTPGQLVAVKCPGEGCGRTLVLVRAPTEVRTYCRDCRTRAIFRVGPGGVTGYDIVPPKEKREKEVNP